MDQDPRINLPRHTLVMHGKKLARVLSRELSPRGKPGLNRVSYRIEHALIRSNGETSWGVYAWRTVPARNLEVVNG